MHYNLSFNVIRFFSTLWMRSRACVVMKGLNNLPIRATGERRVYAILNHSTTFDFIALMHISKEPFTVLMDEGAFHFPVVGNLLRSAGFVPLIKASSEDSVQECVTKVKAGIPLLISLHDGGSTLGHWGRPRTGCTRIAHLAGARIYPVFLKVEEESIRRHSFKDRRGTEYPFTTFKDSFYFIEIMRPIDLAHLPEEATYDDYYEVSRSLDEWRQSANAHYNSFIMDNRYMLEQLRRKGGSLLKVAW